MVKEIPQVKLTKQAYKVLRMYSSRVEMLNSMHQVGTTRHQCMILELVLLGNEYASIKNTLLFTNDSFTKLVNDLYVSLREHKKKLKIHNKLVGR